MPCSRRRSDRVQHVVDAVPDPGDGSTRSKGILDAHKRCGLIDAAADGEAPWQVGARGERFFRQLTLGQRGHQRIARLDELGRAAAELR